MNGRIALLLCLCAGSAGAEDDAKAVFERGTALFALRHFSEAASLYEKAFELRPNPAILYNAAQAHRLAGNKGRALELYQSLLRHFGGKLGNRAEVLDHIRQLNIAIEAERRATSSPPLMPQPRPFDSAAGPSAPVAAPVVVEKSPPPARRRWLWPVVGSSIALVVVAGITIGVVLGTEQTVPPTPTFGTFRGN